MQQISDKVIENKVYLYAGVLHKVRRVAKKRNMIVLRNLHSDEEVTLPYEGSDILLLRVYTIGELCKIVNRRPDTIRKYEKLGLLPKPLPPDLNYPAHKNWRFYRSSDVYDMVEFFSARTPGRPMKKSKATVSENIKSLTSKVKAVSSNIE